MRKFLFLIIILTFFSCQKQEQITEGDEADLPIAADLSIAIENISEEALLKINENVIRIHVIDIIQPESITIINEENYLLENILGTWVVGNHSYSPPTEIEFTEDNIFYLRELDRNYNIISENFYPYEISENTIIIKEADKTNNYSKHTKVFLL